jgi:hypothetical protein
MLKKNHQRNFRLNSLFNRLNTSFKKFDDSQVNTLNKDYDYAKILLLHIFG